VRLILSMVRILVAARLPDVSVNQRPEEAMAVFRLDPSDDIAHIEGLIDT